MLKIRLTRVGKRNSPVFRLVVAEKARAVKRQNIEILGLYNPGTKDNKFQVNKERVLFWISKGAQPSDTAQNLLCDFEVLPKNQKIKTTFGKPQKKKDSKTEKESKPVASGAVAKSEAIKEDKEDIEDKENKEKQPTEETESEKVEEVSTEEEPTEEVKSE